MRPTTHARRRRPPDPSAPAGGRLRPRGTRGRAQRPFSLIEVILALLLVAVLAALLGPFFGASLTHSSDPALRLPATSALMTAMERIAATYEQLYYHDLDALRTRIGAEGTTQNNAYGTYIVVHNAYVTFSAAGAETAGGTATDTLKVTIRDAAGERLTALFPYQVTP